MVKNEPEEKKSFPAAVEPIDDFETDLLEIEDFELDPVPSQGEKSTLTVELSGDRREALKSLASQLLELREMLKSDQTREAEEHIKRI